jgi:hypothetical protein
VSAIPFTAVLLTTFRDLFLILFLALGSVWFALEILHRLRPCRQPASQPATPLPVASASVPIVAPVPAPFTPDPQPVAAAGIPPDHLAVIAATVHHLFRGRGRLTSVSRAMVSDYRWAQEGRRDIFSSHRLR